MFRMGYPPVRLEVLTEISGVEFDECFARRVTATLDGVETFIIALRDLRADKKASAWAKDMVRVATEHITVLAMTSPCLG